ncbi:hypothetical protein ACFLX5_00880 [Chloroflexota bacterium]
MLKEHDKHKQHTPPHKYLLRGLVYSLDVYRLKKTAAPELE